MLIFRKCFDHKTSITKNEVMFIFFKLEFNYLNKNRLRLLGFFGQRSDSVIRKVSDGLSHFGGKIILSIISAIYNTIIHTFIIESVGCLNQIFSSHLSFIHKFNEK